MVHWSPFVMSFKKKYPWIQLAGHAGSATLRDFLWGRLALWGVTQHLWEGRAWPWHALGQVLSENWQWRLQPYFPDVALMRLENAAHGQLPSGEWMPALISVIFKSLFSVFQLNSVQQMKP